MEISLEEKYRETQVSFNQFLSESAKDLESANEELEELKVEISKEKLLNDTLEHQQEVNKLEITQLTDLLAKHQADFDEMNGQHDIKLKELEEIRLRSNEEIKRLSQI